jgi:uncharacterized protein (TIGR00661 family)
MRARPLRVVFFIQGEGRGHMTQALSLKGILEDAGHRVVAAFMGEKANRPIPEFFLRRFQAPVHTYPAPVFVLDSREKGVRPWSSFVHSVRQLPRFRAQLPKIHRLFSAHGPDLLVNFYDLMGGLYTVLFRPDLPRVAAGHQFLFFHPDFPTPPRERFQVSMIRQYTRITAPHSDLRLALSFTPMRDLPGHRLRVVPPLLRERVLDAEPSRGPHILAYVLNPGYGEELERWQEGHPGVQLHCFRDRPHAPAAYSPREGLTYHGLSDDTFLRLLTSCRAFASTAGFESVCEAAYLGKPIFLVPTENHVEQECNALDAERAGLATWGRSFDLTLFLQGLEDWSFKSIPSFREWVRAAPEIYVRLLEGLASGRDPMRITFPPT